MKWLKKLFGISETEQADKSNRIKYRKGGTFFIHEGREYTWGERSHGDFPNTYYHFHSTTPKVYPDAVLLGADMKVAYRACVMARVKGEAVFVSGIIDDKIQIHMASYSDAAKKLHAYSEGGWSYATVSVWMISEIWEERFEADGFILPEGLEGRVPVKW